MNRYFVNIIYIFAMIATVVILDVLFFRNNFWARLISNIGIVLVYLGFYLVFFMTH